MRYLINNVRVVRAVRTRADRLAFFQGVVGGGETSFDMAVDPDGVPLSETLAESASSAEELVVTAELKHRVGKEISGLQARLSGREAIVLKERFLESEPKSLRQVGRQLSLTGERVRQIEGTLLATIQAGLGIDTEQLAAAA